MYVYKIGYWTYEGSDYYYLVHPAKFTDEEIATMIHACAVDAIALDKEEEYSYTHDYGDIHRSVASLMKSKHGFHDIDIAAEWEVFGWGSVFQEGDWMVDDEKLISLVRAIRAAGYTEKDDDYLSWHSRFDNGDKEEVDQSQPRQPQ